MPKKSHLRTKNTTTSVILAFNEVVLFKANRRPGGTCTCTSIETGHIGQVCSMFNIVF